LPAGTNGTILRANVGGTPRMKLVRTSIVALALAAGFARADDLDDRLAACAACHGKQGEGVQGSEYYPHLAGKPAGYLFEQLRGFRDGRRNYPVMIWFVQFADDAYLREIADHYAAKPPRTRAADTGADQLTPERRAVAEKLVEEGDAARGVPACVECHGKALTGLEPGIPALLGLPADYIVAQFGHWRDGVRQGAAPDCMHDVANAIAVEDIRAVATWLSQRSNEASERPAPVASFVPPKACGSLPHRETAP
jgi:cytochrome c553